MNPPVEPLTQDRLMKSAFRYQGALVTYAYARLRDYHLAEDVIQDTLLFMMQHWQDFQPGTSVYAWARQIAYYKILEALRQRQKAEASLGSDKLDAIVDWTLAERLDEEWAERQQTRLAVLQECLSRLNKQSIHLLRGFYANSRSYQELAMLRRQTIEAIRKALFRCRRVLQDCVEQGMKKTEFCQ